jgi:hypothetical protein
MPKTNRLFATLFAAVMFTVLMVPTVTIPVQASTPTAFALVELA